MPLNPTIKGELNFGGRIQSLLFAYSESTFQGLKFLFNPLSSVFTGIWGSNSGPKNNQYLNFVKNQKLWCQTVDNKALIPKPLEFFKIGWRLTEIRPKNGPKDPQNHGFTHWGFCTPVTFDLNLFMSLFALWIYVKTNIPKNTQILVIITKTNKITFKTNKIVNFFVRARDRLWSTKNL